MTISERLRKVITDLNRTAKDVAEDIDLPYRTLQNYLHGEREPNPESLEKISRLGINLHWLLTGEGGMFVQEKDAIDFLLKEFDRFTDSRMPEPLAISAVNFVDLYNNSGEDFSCFPKWLRKRIPKLEPQELQSWVANKIHKSEEGYTTGKTVTLPLHPSLAEKIGMALFEIYGAHGYGALDEKIKIGVYGALYSAFCQIGASETAVPSIEEVKTVIELAIKYGKAPAPTDSNAALNNAIIETNLKKSSKKRPQDE